jgi:hypothetical protein
MVLKELNLLYNSDVFIYYFHTTSTSTKYDLGSISVLLMVKTGVPEANHRPAASR